jgi:predicted nuclease of predicted toxin-antitoxin system
MKTSTSLKGLIRRKSDLDVILIQDVGLRTEDDPVILAWAAEGGRVLLTHDIRTMPGFAAQRIEYLPL